MTAEQLAGELAAAKRTLNLARFRLDQDGRCFGRGMGRDRDLWRRWHDALARVWYLEKLSA
jgi:hypothetical protein